MSIQPLLERHTILRLPAFRAGLEEQLHNPRYAELPFEDQLAILVDLEITRRQDRRLQRRIKLASLPVQADIQDIDLAPAHGANVGQTSTIPPNARHSSTICRPLFKFTPKRRAPAWYIASSMARSRMPPEALILMRSPTSERTRRTSSMVVPRLAQPLPVLTKAAPVRRQIAQACSTSCWLGT